MRAAGLGLGSDPHPNPNRNPKPAPDLNLHHPDPTPNQVECRGWEDPNARRRSYSRSISPLRGQQALVAGLGLQHKVRRCK